MKHLKTYNKLFESVSRKIIEDILFDITDDSNFNVEIKEVDNHLEVYITRGSYLDSRKTREIPGAPTPPGSGYSNNLFLWFEIKDTIIRLCEYVYSETKLDPIDNRTCHPIQRKKSPFRMKSSVNEFGIGWHKAEDFTIGDFISFTSLKLIIKL